MQVGYGDVVAITHVGRAICVVGSTIGLIISAFATTAVLNTSSWKAHDLRAVQHLRIQYFQSRIEHTAATIIQQGMLSFRWRTQKRKGSTAQKQTRITPSQLADFYRYKRGR